MPYYFLREDLNALDERVNALRAEMRSVGKEMGLSCQEGAETFHDNFAFEDGERQMAMISTRLRDLHGIRNHALIVECSPCLDRVAIGCRVTLQDNEGHTIEFFVGSYLVLRSSNPPTVSYVSPLARSVIGAALGERRVGLPGGARSRLHRLQDRVMQGTDVVSLRL